MAPRGSGAMLRTMREQISYSSRWGTVALGLSGLLFATFPLVRPFFNDLAADPTGAAQTITSPRWVVAHVMLIVAFVLLPFGLLTLFADSTSSRQRRLALVGAVLGIAGSGLFLPVVGVEAFALPASANLYLHGQTGTLEAVEAARRGLQATVFLPGLVFLGLGGVFTAVAVWRSDSLPRWAGIPFAIGLVFFMPLLPQGIRLVDGLLTGVGGLWLAWALWRV